jgi:predicted RNase H-like nuclease (RuvC/YqgF family)
MTGRVEDWREEHQDRRIDRLESDLREAREKIRELERRPLEWLFKIELAIAWTLIAAIWVLALVEIANKH